MKRILALLLCLLIASPAWGAITFDNSGTCNPGGEGTSCTQPFTASGSDRLLLVGVCVRNGAAAVSGVTYNAVAMTQYATVSGLGSDKLDIWRLIAPATGANDVVVTMAADSPFSVGISSYNGVDQTTPLGTSANATGAGGDPTVDVSSAAGELVIDYFCEDDGGATIPTMTAGTGQTARVNFTTSFGVPGFERNISSSEEAGAATVTMSWSDTAGNNWITIGGPLKPAAAAPASVRQRSVMILP